MESAIRDRSQRIADTKRHLAVDVDCWVGTAGEGSSPYLIPLSFLWDGDSIWLSTLQSSITGRNLATTGKVRLGFGTTRDVYLIEGTVEAIHESKIDPALGDQFAAKTGFDPRTSEGTYLYFRVSPAMIQAWFEEPELAGRTIMRDGCWLI